MKKKYIYFSIPILLSIVFAVSALKIQSDAKLPGMTLSEAFKATGARLLRSEVYAWAKISDATDDGIEEMEAAVRRLAEGLDGVKKGTLSPAAGSSDLLNEVKLSGELTDGRTVTLGLKSGPDSGGSYLQVSISRDLEYMDMEQTLLDIGGLFAGYGVQPRTNSCITGSFDGRLEDGRIDALALAVFNGSKARTVDGIREENLLSVTAYSPSIGDYITVGDKRVNLNLAVRYSAYEDRTYIWLATPLITTEY